MDCKSNGFYEPFMPLTRDMEREFLYSGCSRAGVFRYAEEIREAFPGSARKALVCTDRKDIIMAAILSSLSGGPEIIIPHSLSEQAIKEIQALEDCPVIAGSRDECPFCPEAFVPEGGRSLAQLPDFSRGPDEPMLTLFTGGSTGAPKAWRKTARNLFGEALYITQRFGISETDLFLSTVPPRHIYGLLFTVLAPFVSKAPIIAETAVFPAEITSAIERHGATVLVSVPIHYRVLRSANLRRGSLRLAFSSAGALDKADADSFYEKTGVAVNEIYGSTETGGVASRRSALNETVLMPFDNLKFRIEKELLKVKSEFVSPDLPKDADGYFTTLDRARREGGGFVLLGRADDIIKVAGKRVDLAEVQEKIKSLDGVTDAKVFSTKSESGRQNEIAAIVVTGLGEPELRAAISRVLEPHCIPRHVKAVRRLPSLPTGKIDRGHLEKMFRG